MTESYMKTEKAKIRKTFSFRMMCLWYVATHLEFQPHPWWTNQLLREVRGSGQLPDAWRSWEEVTFPPRVRAPLVSAGFKADSWRKTHLFRKLMKWSKMWGRQVSIQKTNGQLDTLLIFLLTAWLALLSCRGSNINPTTFMADSFRRHVFFYMCFQFISSCLTSSFLGQHPQVETWLALQRLARNQAKDVRDGIVAILKHDL